MKENRNLKVNFTEDVLKKMDRLLISEDDVYAVVEHCEKDNTAVLNTQTGTLTGHKLIGIITYWVEYKKTESEIDIINAYSHRIQIS